MTKTKSAKSITPKETMTRERELELQLQAKARIFVAYLLRDHEFEEVLNALVHSAGTILATMIFGGDVSATERLLTETTNKLQARTMSLLFDWQVAWSQPINRTTTNKRQQ
jgi:hypothetical protein